MYGDLSKQANRARDNFVVREVEISTASKEIQMELIDIFLKWQSHFAKRYPTFVTYEFVGWNIVAIERIFQEKEHRLFIAREIASNQAIGFFYLIQSTRKQFDMALSFCDFRENDLHRLLYREVLRQLAEENIDFVNMGGGKRGGVSLSL